MNLTYQLIIALIVSSLIGYASFRLRALSLSGAWAAAVAGGLLFGLGGISWAVILMAFFLSSTGLSKMFSQKKQDLSEKFAKGSQRDWGQVAANGGVGVILVIIYFVYQEPIWAWVAYSGAIAAVTADTWATEIGVLSKHRPRHTLTFQPIPRGTSGGISILGISASIAGSIFIGLIAFYVSPDMSFISGVWSVALAGLAGSLFDSFLGATLQSMYQCSVCKKETEQYPHHSCGSQTQFLRGWPWLNNDVVNLLSAVIGAIVAVAIWS